MPPTYRKIVPESKIFLKAASASAILDSDDHEVLQRTYELSRLSQKLRAAEQRLCESLIEMTTGTLKAFCFQNVCRLQAKTSTVRLKKIRHTFINLKTQICILLNFQQFEIYSNPEIPSNSPNTSGLEDFKVWFKTSMAIPAF